MCAAALSSLTPLPSILRSLETHLAAAAIGAAALLIFQGHKKAAVSSAALAGPTIVRRLIVRDSLQAVEKLTLQSLLRSSHMTVTDIEKAVEKFIEDHARGKLGAFAALEPEADKIVEGVIETANKAAMVYGVSLISKRLPQFADTAKQILAALNIQA